MSDDIASAGPLHVGRPCGGGRHRETRSSHRPGATQALVESGAGPARAWRSPWLCACRWRLMGSYTQPQSTEPLARAPGVSGRAVRRSELCARVGDCCERRLSRHGVRAPQCQLCLLQRPGHRDEVRRRAAASSCCFPTSLISCPPHVSVTSPSPLVHQSAAAAGMRDDVHEHRVAACVACVRSNKS